MIDCLVSKSNSCIHVSHCRIIAIRNDNIQNKKRAHAAGALSTIHQLLLTHAQEFSNLTKSYISKEYYLRSVSIKSLEYVICHSKCYNKVWLRYSVDITPVNCPTQQSCHCQITRKYSTYSNLLLSSTTFWAQTPSIPPVAEKAQQLRQKDLKWQVSWNILVYQQTR